MGAACYSLRNLFRDDQRHILSIILESTLANAEDVYRHVYEANAPLLLFLKDLAVPAPRPLAAAAEFVLNANLKREFEESVLNPAPRSESPGRGQDARGCAGRLPAGIHHPKPHGADGRGPSATCRAIWISCGNWMPSRASCRFSRSTSTCASFKTSSSGFCREIFPELQKKARRRDKKAGQWTTLFKSLGDKLGVRTD